MTNSIKGKYAVRRDEVVRLMMEQGWTVSGLAHAADISENSIKRLFKGGDLRMTTIDPLAKQLRTNALALIDDSDSQARTQAGAVGVSDDSLLSPPTTDSQVGPPADAPPEKKEKVCFRFSFEIDVPDSSYREKEQVPGLLAEIGKQILQMGALVIASAQAGSVRIICWATEKGDVDRFFSAFAEGRFDSLRITNPQILDDLIVEPDDDDDKTQTTVDRESTAPSSVPVRSSSTNITEETQSLESDEPLDEPESSSNMNADDRDVLKAAAAGAAAGAIIGSVIPVIGTLAGGFFGGVLGGLFMKNHQALKSMSDDERGVGPPKQKH